MQVKRRPNSLYSIDVEFRRPDHTNTVAGEKAVGLTGDSVHVSECWYGETVGIGSGDSPKAARSNALADLMRRLERGE